MEISKTAVGILAGLCLMAGAGGAYFATRGDAPVDMSVVSEAPLVRSTSSEQGQVIDYKQIQSLPLNGRLFQQLITLTPGAIPRQFADFAENPAAAGARSFVHHTVNGLPWSGNNYLIDGIANNEPLNAFINITPPLEAIQEFKCSPTTLGGVVVSRSGVNLSIRRNQLVQRLAVEYTGMMPQHEELLCRTKAPSSEPVRRHAGRSDPAQPDFSSALTRDAPDQGGPSSSRSDGGVEARRPQRLGSRSSIR